MFPVFLYHALQHPLAGGVEGDEYTKIQQKKKQKTNQTNFNQLEQHACSPFCELFPMNTFYVRVFLGVPPFLCYTICMARNLSYRIEAEGAGQTIGQYLAARGYSTHILRLLRQVPGAVCRNGRAARNIDRLEAGDLLTVTIVDAQKTDIQPVAMPLDIVYEDADILLVNKPSGLSVHPSSPGYCSALANGVKSRYPQAAVRPIHRLDRETSGLVLFAMNPLAAAILGTMMKTRQIQRHYLAVAQGKTPAQGEIVAPLAREQGPSIKRRVDMEKGLFAQTAYERLAYAAGFSLLRLRLATGRTHQIRVHMAHIGHPLAGDTLYGGQAADSFPRLALHAAKLTFPHPISGEPLTFASPFPADIGFLFPTYCETRLDKNGE